MAKKKKSSHAAKVIDQRFLQRYCNLVPDPFDHRDFRYGSGTLLNILIIRTRQNLSGIRSTLARVSVGQALTDCVTGCAIKRPA